MKKPAVMFCLVCLVLGWGQICDAAPPKFHLHTLPTNGTPVWTALNNHCEVVGYSQDLKTTPIYYQGEGMLFDLAAPDAGAVKLGYLTGGDNWHYSHVYDINDEGRMVGNSNDATVNQQRPVEFLRPPGAGVDVVTGHIGNGTRIEAISASGDRMLIIDPPDTFIYDASNGLAHALHSSTDVFRSAAMNDAGQVAIHIQEDTGHNVYLCEVENGALTKTRIAALSDNGGLFGIDIAAMNNSQVIVGIRSVGGVYYPFIYDAVNDHLMHTASAGGTFEDINNDGWVAGARNGPILSQLTTNTVAAVYPLEDCLVPADSGYDLHQATAINDAGVVLVTVNGTAADAGLLVPEGLIPVPGAFHTSVGAGETGSVTVTLTNVTAAGTVSHAYDRTMRAADWDAVHDGFFDALHPSAPTNLPLQSWDLSFSGLYAGVAEVTVTYDPDRLPGHPSVLGILHYDGAAWQNLPGQVDALQNTLTFETPSLSPFVLTITNAGPPTRVLELEGDLAFGDVDVDATAQRAFSVYNGGNAELTVSSIAGPDGFSSPWTGTVASGCSQLVTVTFSPDSATNYSGVLTVNADHTDGSNLLPVSGRGILVTNPVPSVRMPTGEVAAVRPTFEWSAAADATWYQLLVNRNGSRYYRQWIEGSNQWTVTTDFAAGTYTWWVQAWGPVSGTSAWSAPGTFTRISLAPEAPVPGPPTGNTTTNAPRFAWSSALYADWYNLRLQRNGTTCRNPWVAGVTNWTPATPLPMGDYAWWVRGWNRVDGLGDWSAQQTFSYGAVHPLAPTGVVANTRQPECTWIGAPGATWYYLYLARNGKKFTTQWVGGDPQAVVAGGLPGGDYRWWVRPWNAEGYGNWSSAAEFTIPYAVPAAITLVGPTATATAPSVTYSWDADPAATWYHIWVGVGGKEWFSQWYKTGVTNGPIGRVVHGHVPGVTYKWFVRGWSPDGIGPWPAGTSFTAQ